MSQIRLGDLSEGAPEGVPKRERPSSLVPEFIFEVADADGDTDMMSPQEMEDQFRMSTAVLSDWLSQFVEKIFSLYAALPEVSETRAKTGTGTEESVVAMVQVST
jgi:hypothetical protein